MGVIIAERHWTSTITYLRVWISAELGPIKGCLPGRKYAWETALSGPSAQDKRQGSLAGLLVRSGELIGNNIRAVQIHQLVIFANLAWIILVCPGYMA